MAVAEKEVLAVTRPRNPGFWEKWAGKQIVIQTKGRIIITGTFRESREGFVILDSPTIKGIKKTVRPTEVMVDRHQIGHFHEVCASEPDPPTE
jgi:hypothetical protein